MTPEERERLFDAERRCLAALFEGREVSMADEMPLIEMIRTLTPLAEQRLILLARFRERRARRVEEARRGRVPTRRVAESSLPAPSVFPDLDLDG